MYRYQDLHQEPVIEMIQTHQKAGLTAAQSLTTIRIANSTSNLAITRQDIRNLQAHIHREDLDGRSPIQALLFELERDFLTFNNHDTEQRITHLAFFYKESLSLLQQHPEVLILDSTYKVN